MSEKDLYQELYDNETLSYGDASKNRCPGVRLIPKFKGWIKGPVIDLGCGRGDTVAALRKKGFKADGIDQITHNKDMLVGNICKPIDKIETFKSAICIDVIEHIPDGPLAGLFLNLSKTDRQVISIHNGSCKEPGYDIELHINRKPFPEWEKILNKYFVVHKKELTKKHQMLYFCSRK